MKFLVVVCLLGAFAATANGGKQYSFGHMNVFNYMKVLTNPEIYALIAQKEVQWPTYDTIPPASFSCAQKDFPGFYAGRCFLKICFQNMDEKYLLQTRLLSAKHSIVVIPTEI